MRNFILGTDWWDDCDDAVAVRLLARAHKSGEISLKGIGINACMEESVAALDGFLQAEQVTDVPIGIDLAATDFGGEPPYQKRLAALCKRYQSNHDAWDAVRLYRHLLSISNQPVEILEIGFLQVLANLLLSEPDYLSPLCGLDLVKEKVTKVWIMAGKWDEDGGLENNFARNPRSRQAARVVCQQCPVPITFLGFEIGYQVITGGGLPEGDVLHQVLCDYNTPDGRHSWDPMLAHLALVGDEAAAGYSLVRGRASVDAVTGANTFVKEENGPHGYVVKQHPDAFYEQAINERIAAVL